MIEEVNFNRPCTLVMCLKFCSLCEQFFLVSLKVFQSSVYFSMCINFLLFARTLLLIKYFWGFWNVPFPDSLSSFYLQFTVDKVSIKRPVTGFKTVSTAVPQTLHWSVPMFTLTLGSLVTLLCYIEHVCHSLTLMVCNDWWPG